ncbi:beta-ketoacyl synthase N-terminal-like domain-containing protein [uncultured Planktosalinus sp.]|uniref:beta-ketoacyl synthase N-terminal-like domain-containing protein n=1 Tax=uncultured Planktosalinus sp. TaxID=1810935 RepID=UPI0030DC9B01
MKKCYINGIGCISAQNTFDGGFLDEVELNTTDVIFSAKNPDYKAFISPGAIRRMAKGVKMGIAASQYALKEAGVVNPDAIITGTGMGCLQDSEKFLKAIIANQEQYLTPTSFIQSTHNTVGAQIALNLQCKGYNFTYVNGPISFESALLDALLQIETGETATILAGGVDETSSHTLSLYELIGLIKKKHQGPFDVLDPKTPGAVFSEGAGFFVLENQKKSTSYAILEAVETHNALKKSEVALFIDQFLRNNNLKAHDIDLIVLGNNGDVAFDGYYDEAETLFPNTSQLYYKHLCGEYNTATTFGLWTALQILKKQEIPQIFQKNQLTKHPINRVLLYNQYRGKDHSLTLLNHADL